MSRPAPAAPLPQEKQIENFLAGNFGGSTIDEMFSKAEVVKLKLLIVQRADQFNGDLSKVLPSLSKSLETLGEYNSDLRNVDRQAYQIKEAELKPGKIDVSERASAIGRQVPFEGQDPKGGYFSGRSNVAGVASSVWGGSKEARQAVRKNKSLDNPSRAVPSTYRNLVMDARSDCRSDIAIAEANLFAELNGDPQLTRKQEKKIRTSNHRVASNISEFAAFGALKGFNWLTRGILSHSKAAEDSRFIDYQKGRDDLIAGARTLLDKTSQGKTAYLNALKRFYEGLASSPEALSPKEFAELQQLISDAIVAEGKATKDEVEAFNKKINELNDEMLKGMKDLLKEEDNAWKYRIAQIFLIMSPLGFFNYMLPVANILGPIFSANLTFGEGIGKMMTEVPIFGDIVAAIRIDVAVAAIVDNVPILSEFGHVIDAITDTEAAQNLFGAVSPIVTGSPLIPIAIAIAFSGRQAEKSFDRGDKSKALVEGAEKKLKAEFEKLSKNIEGDPHKQRIAKFAAAEMDGNANRVFLRSLVDFIASAKEEELAIFDGVKFNGKSLLDLKREKEAAGEDFSSPTAIMNLLLASDVTKDMRGQLIKAFFAYDKIREDHEGSDSLETEEEAMAHNLGNFRNLNPDAMSKLAQDEYVRRRQEFVIDFAENVGLPQSIYQGDDPESRKLMAAEYEARIIQNKVNRRDNVLAFTPAKEKPPATSPVPPITATPTIAQSHLPPAIPAF